MNKYQEALDWLKNRVCEKGIECDCCDFNGNCDYQKYVNERYSLLQKLVDKATPKKPIEKHYEDVGEPEYIKTCCPNGCKVQVGNYYNYCPRCGQRLVWGDD